MALARGRACWEEGLQLGAALVKKLLETELPASHLPACVSTCWLCLQVHGA
jgi:hypothetical protein